MTARIGFFNFADDKLYYDERKKRFVFMEDAPAIVYKTVNNSHFKEVLPSSLPSLAKTRSLRTRTCRVQKQA